MGISYSGVIYSSGTITATGNTGATYLRWSDLIDPLLVHLNPQQMFLRLVPLDLLTDETLDLVLNQGFDSAGSGAQDIHAFTQVTSTKASENLILPGEESTGILTSGVDLLPAPLLPFYKLTWTLAGGTKSMSFILYGHILFS